MRGTRLLVAVGVTLTAVLVGPAAVGAQAPAGDSVTGTGTLVGPAGTAVTFVLDVHSGPSGENATGTLVNTTGGLTFPVTCLAVAGNRAVIGTEAQASFAIVEDNGSPGTGLDTLATTFPGAACTEPGATELGPFTLTAGDFLVVDAQPFPTTKDQCKNGGWQKFPQFQNQLQCNLFVDRTCGERGRFEPKPKNCPVRLPNR